VGKLPQGCDFILNGWWDEDTGEQLRQELQLLNSLQSNERTGI
jgi:predicted AlkP superfamily pyrophosphatase or phosphodiesterase